MNSPQQKPDTGPIERVRIIESVPERRAKYLWRGFEGIAIIVAIVALLLAIEGNKEIKIINAWTILSTKITGQSGKKEALEILHKEGNNLSHIDLSCEEIGGMNPDGTRCDNPVILRRVNLPGANLSRADLSGADLFKADLSRVNLGGADLSGANLSEANLSGAKFCHKSFSCAKITRNQIDQAWAWKDNLPDFGTLELEIQPRKQCDPGGREAYKQEKRKGKPEGC